MPATFLANLQAELLDRRRWTTRAELAQAVSHLGAGRWQRAVQAEHKVAPCRAE